MSTYIFHPFFPTLQLSSFPAAAFYLSYPFFQPLFPFTCSVCSIVLHVSLLQSLLSSLFSILHIFYHSFLSSLLPYLPPPSIVLSVPQPLPLFLPYSPLPSCLFLPLSPLVSVSHLSCHSVLFLHSLFLSFHYLIPIFFFFSHPVSLFITDHSLFFLSSPLLLLPFSLSLHLFISCHLPNPHSLSCSSIYSFFPFCSSTLLHHFLSFFSPSVSISQLFLLPSPSLSFSSTFTDLVFSPSPPQELLYGANR